MYRKLPSIKEWIGSVPKPRSSERKEEQPKSERKNEEKEPGNESGGR